MEKKMIQKIKRNLENIAGITALAVALSPFGLIGYEIVFRLNPSYKTDRIEEVYFEKENNSRRILWRSPFVWDETGNKIIGYRNNNADVSINLPWRAEVDNRDLKVISDVRPNQRNYAEIKSNGYGKITKVELHIKPNKAIPDYDSGKDGAIEPFLDKQ